MYKKIFFIILLGITATALNAQKKYSGRIDFGIASENSIILYTTHGKFFKPNMFVGLGTGINSPMYSSSQGVVVVFPLFAEVQYIPFKTFVSPFFSAQMGVDNTIITRRIDLENNKINKHYKFIGFVSPIIGIRLRIFRSFHINLKYSASFRTGSTYGIPQLGMSYSLGIEF